MSIPKLLFAFVFSIILSAGLAQPGSVKNPLLVHNNQPIPFDKVGAATVRDAVSGLVRISDDGSGIIKPGSYCRNPSFKS